MSNVEQDPPKDKGTFTPSDPSLILTPQERDAWYKYTANPMDVAPEWRSYWEQWMRDLLTSGNILGLTPAWVTGDVKVIAKDLTAETSLYLYEDSTGVWAYANGATLTSSEQALIDFIGTSTLPDTRGRSLWLTGTNTALDLFDNDGVAEASRQPKHTHTDNIGISGTVSGTFASSTHTHTVSVAGSGTVVGSGAQQIDTSVTSGTPSATASVSENLGISGSVGSGMNGSDAVAHIAIGSCLIKV